MELTGSGNITIEQALPTTDNNTNSKTIAIGSSKSESDNIGFSFTGMTTPGASLGVNYSHGWTKGTSFTMSSTTVAKDLKVVKNTKGSIVIWTYECGQEIKLYTDNKNKSKEGHNGDKKKLTEALMTQFPEVFQTLTRVADRTIDSENAIQYTVAYAKNIINDKNGGRTMREYAQDLGCNSYTIRWYCMDGNHNDYELTITAY